MDGMDGMNGMDSKGIGGYGIRTGISGKEGMMYDVTMVSVCGVVCVDKNLIN